MGFVLKEVSYIDNNQFSNYNDDISSVKNRIKKKISLCHLNQLGRITPKIKDYSTFLKTFTYTFKWGGNFEKKSKNNQMTCSINNINGFCS